MHAERDLQLGAAEPNIRRDKSNIQRTGTRVRILAKQASLLQAYKILKNPKLKEKEKEQEIQCINLKTSATMSSSNGRSGEFNIMPILCHLDWKL